MKFPSRFFYGVTASIASIVSIASITSAALQTASLLAFSRPPQAAPVRCVFARAYGANESLPPVIMLNTSQVNGVGVGLGVDLRANMGTGLGAAPGTASNTALGTSAGAAAGSLTTPAANTFRWGSATITLEFDILATLQPNVVAQFVHCDAAWNEDNASKNSAAAFVNDPAEMRTTQTAWTLAPPASLQYNHRGRMQIPNTQVQFRVSGNWKAKIYDQDALQRLQSATNSGEKPLAEPLAELRFFVVEQAGQCRLALLPDTYSPQARAARPSAYTLETSMEAIGSIVDEGVRTVVSYRNHRWFEPMMVRYAAASTQTNDSASEYRSTFAPAAEFFCPTGSHREMRARVEGAVQIGKRFRLEKVPAQEQYRQLNTTNFVLFPSAVAPQRLPLPDVLGSQSALRARLNANNASSGNAPNSTLNSTPNSTLNSTLGGALDVVPDGVLDGGMLANGFRADSPGDDEYVVVDFFFDPLGFPSPYDVYLLGSFNNWRVRSDFKMFYNAEQRLYGLRAAVPRGRHQYLYATGKQGAKPLAADALNFEEFEGNSLDALNTFLSFVYYSDPALGGMERIVGAAGANPAAR
jgi:hypothetical protein